MPVNRFILQIVLKVIISRALTVFYTIFKLKMISRRPGGGDEAYVIHAIMAQITGKENICFLLCPLRVALPYYNTLRKPTTPACARAGCSNKDSAFI
jgi:hypothetical protein